MLKQFEVCEQCEEIFTKTEDKIVVPADLKVETYDAVKKGVEVSVLAKKEVYHKKCLADAVKTALAKVKGVSL